MKILLANHMLGGGTGSETWIDTMKAELEKHHEIYLFSADVHSAQNLKFEPDLAMINHHTCLKQLRHLPCKKIFTSHGVLPALEQPVWGADIYVSVSEEVQQNLRGYGFESIIIRNPIDCEKFKATKPVNKKLTNVLFASHYQGKALSIIKQACQDLGLNLEVIGKGNQVRDVKERMNNADLVIALGRTAYEAMACERNVIIYDYNGADGFVTPESMVEYRKNNCSGRRYRKDYTVNDLKEQFKKYDPALGKELREYILQNNNISKIAKQYLSL